MKLVKTEYGNWRCPDDPGEIGYDNWQRRSVTEEETAILSRWAKGKKVLEIGTGLGVSTSALAQTALSVVTVDPDPWVQCEIEGVEFRRDWPEGRFDLIFIDGDHSYQATRSDIQRARGMAPLIALHDTYLMEVAAAIRDEGLKAVETCDTVCKIALYEA